MSGILHCNVVPLHQSFDIFVRSQNWCNHDLMITQPFRIQWIPEIPSDFWEYGCCILCEIWDGVTHRSKLIISAAGNLDQISWLNCVPFPVSVSFPFLLHKNEGSQTWLPLSNSQEHNSCFLFGNNWLRIWKSYTASTICASIIRVVASGRYSKSV